MSDIHTDAYARHILKMLRDREPMLVAAALVCAQTGGDTDAKFEEWGEKIANEETQRKFRWLVAYYIQQEGEG